MDYIVYFDETGDDGSNTKSCDTFLLTSVYMSIETWQNNYNKIQELRVLLKTKYGFHIKTEIHTKHFICDKEPYRDYKWTYNNKKEILNEIISCIEQLDIKIINVLIDKTKIKTANYKVLENALTYNIQRIDNDSKTSWKYIVITDKGRIIPMKKTARTIRAFNPIPSKYSPKTLNKPIESLIEDVLEKDSKESHFIQITDFISYLTHLYYKTAIQGKSLPNRAKNLVDNDYIVEVMERLKKVGKFNLKANSKNAYGIVIYPK